MLEALPKSITLAKDPFITALYLFGFLLLAINFMVSNIGFAKYISRIFALKYKETGNNGSLHTLITLFVGVIGFAIFSILVINTSDDNIFISDTAVNYFTILNMAAKLILTIAVYMIFNVITLLLIRYTFSMNRDQIADYAKFFTLSFIDLGVMLFFVSFVSLYIPLGGRYVLYVLGIMLVIHFIIKIIAGAFQLFSFETSALYRFFLYLCTLEILPILVLIKYLSTVIV